jgi:hypothetical protein
MKLRVTRDPKELALVALMLLCVFSQTALVVFDILT